MAELKTPLTDWHVAHGAKMAPFAGWLMPIQYEGILVEHQHTRQHAGLFDICHMGEFRIRGAGADAALAAAVSHNLATLAPGRCRYGFLLTEKGTVLDDCIVYRFGPDDFMVVVNAACAAGDFATLRARLPEDVALTDISEQTGKIDLQGPEAVDVLSGRSEFYTSYTPYQAECSQGTLQAIFEYQTAVSRLLDMDCANASVYDGGTALFEACMMAVRATRRKKLVVDQCINPIWRAMLETYSSSLDITLVTVPHKDGLSDMEGLKAAVDATCAAVLVQNPNFFGAVADFSELFAHARACKALGVISVYPVMQSVLKTPGEMGADIAVAEGQSLGQPLSFGGPYLGIMTCRKEHIRQFPGRIVGRTTDLEGRTGYVLTLQAREQHIRRAKATSNICSNQSLCALRALMYLSLVGPDGLARVAEHGMALARYAVEKLTALPGVSLLNDAPFGNEVALRLPRPAEEVVQALLRRGVAAGYPVGRAYAGMDDVLLLACTECNTRAQVDAMVEKLGGLL